VYACRTPLCRSRRRQSPPVLFSRPPDCPSAPFQRSHADLAPIAILMIWATRISPDVMFSSARRSAIVSSFAAMSALTSVRSESGRASRHHRRDRRARQRPQVTTWGRYSAELGPREPAIPRPPALSGSGGLCPAFRRGRRQHRPYGILSRLPRLRKRADRSRGTRARVRNMASERSRQESPGHPGRFAQKWRSGTPRSGGARAGVRPQSCETSGPDSPDRVMDGAPPVG
jgi:hypothetical protein